MRSWSLSALSERVLGLTLKKEGKLRLSDWEARLCPEQLEYAAVDALASMRCCEELERAPRPAGLNVPSVAPPHTHLLASPLPSSVPALLTNIPFAFIFPGGVPQVAC